VQNVFATFSFAHRPYHFLLLTFFLQDLKKRFGATLKNYLRVTTAWV